MGCSECGRELTGQPNAMCPAPVHWRAWAERLAQVIEDANSALFDACAHDIEHQIDSHSDTLPQLLRSVAAGAQKALDVLQVVIHERVGGE